MTNERFKALRELARVWAAKSTLDNGNRCYSPVDAVSAASALSEALDEIASLQRAADRAHWGPGWD